MLPEIKLMPQPYQAEAMLDFTTPIVGVSAGKRSGKTRIITVEKAIVTSALHPGHTIIVASPTYGMTRRNILPLFREAKERMGLDIEGLDVKSPSELRIRWGGFVSTIVLDVTIENFGRMNGMSVAAVFADEIDKARYEDAEAFIEEAMIRCSKPYPGRVAQLNVTGAPELNGYMAEFFIEKAGPDRKLYKWSMMQNMAISKEYKELMLKNIPESKQPGWIHGEFMYNSEGRVYECYDPQKHHTDLTLQDLHPNEKIDVMFDINDGGMSVILGVRRGDFFFAIDEWMKMKDTQKVIDKVKAQPWAHRAIISCDPACTQVFPYIVRSGLQYEIMKSSPEVIHRVTATELRFGTSGLYSPSTGEHKPHLLINTKRCKVLNKCFMRQGYMRVGDKSVPDKKTWIEDAGTDISGPIDALTYRVYAYWPYDPREPNKRIVMRGFS